MKEIWNSIKEFKKHSPQLFTTLMIILVLGELHACLGILALFAKASGR
jgi:hypothetical protein